MILIADDEIINRLMVAIESAINWLDGGADDADDVQIASRLREAKKAFMHSLRID